jgi:hypothetical protein
LLTLIVAAARLGYVIWEQQRPRIIYHTTTATTSPPANATPEISLGLDALRGKLAASIPNDVLSPGASPAAGRATQPTSMRVYLIVNVRPDRSEVLINGAAYGHTPYVGEIGCQRGSNIAIAVLPPKGMPKKFERSCDRQEIRIDE